MHKRNYASAQKKSLFANERAKDLTVSRLMDTEYIEAFDLGVLDHSLSLLFSL
jgi:hypothetical protein